VLSFAMGGRLGVGASRCHCQSGWTPAQFIQVATTLG
jgi:hypothetical protein